MPEALHALTAYYQGSDTGAESVGQAIIALLLLAAPAIPKVVCTGDCEYPLSERLLPFPQARIARCIDRTTKPSRLTPSWPAGHPR